jgi:hypothetical protein
MRRPPISRQTLRTLLVTLYAIFLGGIRIFAWHSLREGFIDVRPLPRVARFLSITMLVIVFAFIASILFNDALRWSGTLELLPKDSSGARGLFVPTTAVPVAYLATILAWTFLLTGALHVRAAVRWIIFFCFLFFGLPELFVSTLQGATLEHPEILLLLACVAGIMLLGMVLLMVLAPRQRLPLAVEFLCVLALVGGLFLLNLYTAVESSHISAVDFVNGYLVPDAVTNPRNLIFPFLYVAGAEMIGFGISLTGWGAQSTQRFGRDWMFGFLLLVLLAYRWIDFVWTELVPGVSANQIQHWLGALLAGIALVPVAVWRARHPFDDRVPLKLVVALILVITLPQLLIQGMFVLATLLFTSNINDPGALGRVVQLSNAVLAVSSALRDGLYLVLAVCGGVVAVLAQRRKRYTVAAYGMIFAWTQFVWWFMENGRPLQEWRYHYQDMDLWLTLALTTLAIFWLARRALDTPRTLALLGLAFFGWVLNFTDFIDNPLALFFGFAGIFFTAFGILWSVLTAGGKFANSDSPAFPRLNRIILYLGYVLLTLNISHWFTVTHNVEQQVFNNDITLTGLRVFGYTAAYLVFVEGGRALLKTENV